MGTASAFTLDEEVVESEWPFISLLQLLPLLPFVTAHVDDTVNTHPFSGADTGLAADDHSCTDERASSFHSGMKSRLIVRKASTRACSVGNA